MMRENTVLKPSKPASDMDRLHSEILAYVAVVESWPEEVGVALHLPPVRLLYDPGLFERCSSRSIHSTRAMMHILQYLGPRARVSHCQTLISIWVYFSLF
jgi:hypothetical protein